LALKDTEKDYNDDKFDLIDQIRDQRQDVQFYTKLIMGSLSHEDLEKLRLKSKWRDANNSFDIPGFMITNKKMTFPKIPKFEILNNWGCIQNTRYVQFTGEENLSIRSNSSK